MNIERGLSGEPTMRGGQEVGDSPMRDVQNMIWETNPNAAFDYVIGAARTRKGAGYDNKELKRIYPGRPTVESGQHLQWKETAIGKRVIVVFPETPSGQADAEQALISFAVEQDLRDDTTLDVIQIKTGEPYGLIDPKHELKQTLIVGKYASPFDEQPQTERRTLFNRQPSLPQLRAGAAADPNQKKNGR